MQPWSWGGPGGVVGVCPPEANRLVEQRSVLLDAPERRSRYGARAIAKVASAFSRSRILSGGTVMFA